MRQTRKKEHVCHIHTHTYIHVLVGGTDKFVGTRQLLLGVGGGLGDGLAHAQARDEDALCVCLSECACV